MNKSKATAISHNAGHGFHRKPPQKAARRSIIMLGGKSMSEKKPPKTIATINFKGGVGKTTVTWCLGDLISTYGSSNVLLFDLDAQMSLTQAITLNEDGSLFRKFSDWSERSEKKGKQFSKVLKLTLANQVLISA